MFFDIRKLEIEFCFNSSFGLIKPFPLLLKKMPYNIKTSNKINVIKNMTGG